MQCPTHSSINQGWPTYRFTMASAADATMTYGRLFTVPSTKNPTHASQNRRPCTVPVRAASPSPPPPPELASALSSVSAMSKRDVMSWSSSLRSPSLDAARRRDDAFIEVMSCWQEETWSQPHRDWCAPATGTCGTSRQQPAGSLDAGVWAATVDQIGAFRATNGFLWPWRATYMTLMRLSLAL